MQEGVRILSLKRNHNLPSKRNPSCKNFRNLNITKSFFSLQIFFILVLYPEFFWAYWYIYLVGTWVEVRGPCRLEVLSGKPVEFRISRLLKCTSSPGLRSFYKLCSKKFGVSIMAPIPIQQCKNVSGCDTVCGLCVLVCVVYFVSWLNKTNVILEFRSAIVCCGNISV